MQKVASNYDQHCDFKVISYGKLNKSEKSMYIKVTSYEFNFTFMSCYAELKKEIDRFAMSNVKLNEEKK